MLQSKFTSSGLGRLLCGHTGLFESGCEAVRWAEPPPETFELRVGPDYKANRLKGVSGPALYEPVLVRVFYSERNVRHATPALNLPPYCAPPGVVADANGHVGGLHARLPHKLVAHSDHSQPHISACSQSEPANSKAVALRQLIIWRVSWTFENVHEK